MFRSKEKRQFCASNSTITNVARLFLLKMELSGMSSTCKAKHHTFSNTRTLDGYYRYYGSLVSRQGSFAKIIKPFQFIATTAAR